MLKKATAWLSALAFSAAAILFTGGHNEQALVSAASPTFPTREVRIVVPYNPGGQSDVMARKIASIIELNAMFGKPVVITNIAGAGTRDGLRIVLQSAPDGHTVLLHHSALLTMRSLNLIPWNYTDFTVLAQVAQAPMVVVTRKSSPWNSIADLVAAGKEQPGAHSVAIQGGLGSNAHFVIEMILRASGANFRRVAFTGGADARAALLGGHVDWGVSSLTESIPYVRSGDLKILGITSEERLPGLDVPTLREQGFDITFNIHTAIFGPKDMPAHIRESWESVLSEVVATEEYRSFSQSNFTLPRFLSGAEAEKVFSDQWSRLEPIAEIIQSQARK